MIAQKPGFRRGILLGIPILIPFQTDFFKAIGRVAPGAAPAKWNFFSHVKSLLNPRGGTVEP
jgi:hypothetical protein